MEVRPGYKQTEVGIIPKDWTTGTLEGVCLPGGLVRGPFGGAIKKEFFVRDGYKVYEQRNAIYREATLGSYFIDEDKYKELQRFELKEGDFIVSCSGTIGRIFQIPKHARLGVINQALLKIKTDSRVVHDRFFFYVFDWDKFQQKIIDNTQGGAMHNLVGMDVFRGVHMPLPPLPEQQAIAAVLSDVDALISALDKLIAKKRDIKKAAMQQLLTGKKRLPGFRGTWEVKKLGEIVLINMGQSPSSQNYNHEGIGIPLIQGNAGIENRETIGRVWTTQVTKVCGRGDLILTVRAPVGSIAIAAAYSCLGRGVCSLKPLGYSSAFLFHSLVFAENRWRTLEQGSTFTAANSAQIAEFPLLITESIEEQTAIAGILSDMDAEIAALERRRDKTRALKQGMMQELLTGRIRLVGE